MESSQETAKQGRLTAIKVLLIIFTIIGIIIVVWGLLIDDGGMEYENRTNTNPVDISTQPPASQNVPQEPSNPNVTGGSTGAGTGNSNDDSTPTPSPAGGVDSNQIRP
jgi:hypothetical protein